MSKSIYASLRTLAWADKYTQDVYMAKQGRLNPPGQPRMTSKDRIQAYFKCRYELSEQGKLANINGSTIDDPKRFILTFDHASDATWFLLTREV